MVIDTLRDILVDLGFEPDELELSKHLVSELELDSAELVQVSFELRRRLGVDVALDPSRDPTLAEVVELAVI